MNADELRQHYFFQFSRKQDVQSTLRFASTLIVLFVGALAFYAPRLTAELGLLEVLFVIAALLVVLAGAFVAVALVRSKYAEISTAKALLAYKGELTAYYALDSTPNGNATSEYNEVLLSKYAAVVDQNAAMNRFRSARVYNAHCALVVAGVVLGLAVIPYAERSRNPASREDAETTELNQMSDDKNPKAVQGSSTSEGSGGQQHQPEPPPKPQPPPNLETRDGSGTATEKDG